MYAHALKLIIKYKCTCRSRNKGGISFVYAATKRDSLCPQSWNNEAENRPLYRPRVATSFTISDRIILLIEFTYNCYMYLVSKIQVPMIHVHIHCTILHDIVRTTCIIHVHLTFPGDGGPTLHLVSRLSLRIFCQRVPSSAPGLFGVVPAINPHKPHPPRPTADPGNSCHTHCCISSYGHAHLGHTHSSTSI